MAVVPDGAALPEPVWLAVPGAFSGPFLQSQIAVEP